MAVMRYREALNAAMREEMREDESVFLMGEGASYITGTVLPVDGGLTAMMGVHRT